MSIPSPKPNSLDPQMLDILTLLVGLLANNVMIAPALIAATQLNEAIDYAGKVIVVEVVSPTGVYRPLQDVAFVVSDDHGRSVFSDDPRATIAANPAVFPPSAGGRAAPIQLPTWRPGMRLSLIAYLPTIDKTKLPGATDSEGLIPIQVRVYDARAGATVQADTGDAPVKTLELKASNAFRSELSITDDLFLGGN